MFSFYSYNCHETLRCLYFIANLAYFLAVLHFVCLEPYLEFELVLFVVLEL